MKRQGAYGKGQQARGKPRIPNGKTFRSDSVLDIARQRDQKAEDGGMAAVGHERHQRIRPDLNEQRAGYGNKQSAYSERNHQEIADKFVQASGALKGRVENGRFKMVPFQNKKNAYAQYHGKDI